MQSPPSSPNPADDSHVHRDIRYSDEYADSLMRIVLESPSTDGTVVLGKGSNASASGDTVRLQEAQALNVDADELPLPLNDSRRVYRSNVPGVRLTHPGGLVEGGRAPSVPSGTAHSNGQVPLEIQQYARHLIRNNEVKTAAALKKVIHAETQEQLKELKRQMQERSDAIDTNERITKEVKQKEAERATERKVEEKLRQQAKSRRDT